MRTLAPPAAAQLVGNALLLWLGYYWLGLGETRASTLAWSALVALLLLALECWLQGATLIYFAGQLRPFGAVKASPRRLLPLVGFAIALLAVYAVLYRFENASGKPAFQIASFLTMTLHKPVKPASMERVFGGAFWLARWMIVPALALPSAAAIAARDWRGIRPRRWLYWMEVPVLLVCAFWLPLKLMSWTPLTGGFAKEMFSFLTRLLLAYLLFVAAWVALLLATCSGRPRATQVKTAASP